VCVCVCVCVFGWGGDKLLHTRSLIVLPLTGFRERERAMERAVFSVCYAARDLWINNRQPIKILGLDGGAE